MFTDIHAHILPGVDDGASDADASLAVLQAAVECGTDAIVATPHLFHPERSEPGVSVDALKSIYRELKQTVSENKLAIRLFFGAEVFISPDTIKLALTGFAPTLNGTRNMLVEFDFDAPPGMLLKYARQLLSARFTPVIAHAERYDAIKREADLAEDLADLGCLIQINQGSFFGDFGRSAMNTAYELIERECVDIIASDTHDAWRRSPDLGKAYLKLSEVCEADYLQELFRTNPNRLLIK